VRSCGGCGWLKTAVGVMGLDLKEVGVRFWPTVVLAEMLMFEREGWGELLLSVCVSVAVTETGEEEWM